MHYLLFPKHAEFILLSKDRLVADTILTKKGAHGHQAHNMHPLSLITDGQHFMRKQKGFSYQHLGNVHPVLQKNINGRSILHFRVNKNLK